MYNEKGEPPLIQAVSLLNVEIFDAFIDFHNKKQIKVTHFNEGLKTALDLISKNDLDIEKVKSIIKSLLKVRDIDPNCYNENNTLLTYFCETNNISLVEILLKNDKTDVNLSVPRTGNTPLLVAIERKNTEIIKLLIDDNRTDINMKNYKRQSPLIMSVNKNLKEIVNLLLNNESFDPYESDISYALYVSRSEITKELINNKDIDVNYVHFDRDTNVHHKINSYKSVLMKSVINNDKEKVEIIIQHRSFD